MTFFSGIPLEDQASAGSSGRPGTRGAGLVTAKTKAGSPPRVFRPGGGSNMLMLEEDRIQGTRGSRFWKRLLTRATGFAVGAISGVATGGASAVIFRPRGRIAQAAPAFARAVRRGSGFGLGLGRPGSVFHINQPLRVIGPEAAIQETIGIRTIVDAISAAFGATSFQLDPFLK